MSNCYTQFSSIVYNITKDEKDWLEEQFTTEENTLDGLPCDMEFENREGKTDLWLYAEETFNLEGLADILQAFLAKFRPQEIFSLTYACTCTKLRPGEFGGGYCIVTGKEIIFGNVWQDAQRHKEAL